MKIIYLVKFILLFGIVSCNTNDDSDSSILFGTYSEASPVNGRSQLEFISNYKVIKTESGTNVEDVYTYELQGNTIKLTPTLDNSSTTEFEIEILHTSKFKIQNLFPSVGIHPITFMTFEK